MKSLIYDGYESYIFDSAFVPELVVTFRESAEMLSRLD